MQTANVLLALAGHKGNTVFKAGVTAAEIAVLRLIHGNDAVTEIEPTGEIKRSHRDELTRLRERYGAMEGETFQSKAVNSLFPGAAARVFERLDELDIPEEFFKAQTRMSAEDAARIARLDEPNNDVDPPTSDVDDGRPEANDGIGEINDAHSDKSQGESSKGSDDGLFN